VPTCFGCPKQSPLLPKLQGQFAEFLQQNSLKRLSLLNPPTCVGLKYGLFYLKLFLGKHKKQKPTVSIIVYLRHFKKKFYFPLPNTFVLQLRGRLFYVILKLLLKRISLASKTLGLRRQSFSLCLTLLMPVYSLLIFLKNFTAFLFLTYRTFRYHIAIIYIYHFG